MNKLIIRGSWNVSAGKLKQSLGVIIDDDFLYVEGSKDLELGRLQLIAGKLRKQVLNELSKV